MQLCALLKDIEVKKIYGNDRIFTKGITYDSRKAGTGYIFTAIMGLQEDGHDYVNKAIENGASALIVEKDVDVPAHITKVVVQDSRKALAHISKKFYGAVDELLTLIGVTGTNGKTSTTYLIKSILEKAGRKAGLLGTIMNIVGDEQLEAVRTTPEASDLFKYLTHMKGKDVDSVVMEVSSHSLELKRVDSCSFDIGVFTNLTTEHLDFHKTMENYYLAKKRLFDLCGKAVVNVDDNYGRRILEEIHIPVITYGITEESDVRAEDIRISIKGSEFVLTVGDETVDIKLEIPGEFNIYNALAATAACYLLGITLENIKEGLEAVKCMPGRMEVLNTNTPYTVLLDYAHTPDGLEKILKTTKDFTKGRIITLFGAGGDRDSTKRQVMGEIAGKFSDFCIITSDNPRTEEPMSIIHQIEKGIIKTGCYYIIIENRKEAIRHALKEARENDVIILAGKGHETYQIIGRKVIDFDEKKIVDEILREERLNGEDITERSC